MTGSVIHEFDEGGRAACGAKGALLISDPPGGSNCGQSACREIRDRITANNRQHFLLAWKAPLTPAQGYAAKAYRELKETICPSGHGHEGNGAGAEWCSSCIATALAKAFEKGVEYGVATNG